MKCVILCGGKGTRLREETEFKPKPLVEIGKHPIIWHIMKIYSHYGVNEFILTLGYKGDLIKRYFMEYHWIDNNFTINLRTSKLNIHENGVINDDWDVTCVDTGIDSGTALRLFGVKNFLHDEEDFCLTYGDGVSNVNIEDLIKFHKKHKKIVTITGLHPRSKFGLMISNKENVVVDFQEKPILPDNINGGFMVINRKIFDYLEEENSMLVQSILPKLASMGEVIVYEFDGFWQSMDTYKDYKDLNDLWKSNPIWKVWR